ncbi:gluconokinase [Litchfieldia salsa]|uniref:Gluconate kinase, FGGY family n=1 Tax=Litchfieldia salsa TaxID=930152 RepID=A0A1H0VQI0_9BACI|nr:gluconokinase [Litchfieldia salsa]SDP80757.1 gluconate kinase, FGGY family [Litchfieldia salsa]
MAKDIVIGLDIGTTSVKAVAFNKHGMVHYEAEVEYPLLTPQPGWAEQDPIVIEQSTLQVIKNLVLGGSIKPSDILSFGISSAMHSLICIDKNGNPLSNSITWADGRSTKQAREIKDNYGHLIYQQTGTPIHPMSPLTKLVWMKENNYNPYKQASKFISIKEFILYRWFGAELVDYSIASASGLFDLHTLDWNSTALTIAGITKEQLFKPVKPTEVITGLKSHIAKEIGIRNDIPFVIGASDGPLANIGIGAISPGEVAITIGTSGAIRQIVPTPKTDKLQQTFCYAITDSLSLIGGPTNNGGIVLRWLRDTIGHEGSYEELIALAKDVLPGSENLLFLPYLNGERAPLWNSDIRGSFIGLSLRHKKEHMIRAGLEGVIFSIYHVGQALERLAGSPQKILASGGFARSSLWLQILADVFNQEVQVPVSHQSSAWGAAWLSLYGIGEVNSLEQIKQHIPMQGSYLPDKKGNEKYQEMFKMYKDFSITLNNFKSK